MELSEKDTNYLTNFLFSIDNFDINKAFLIF